MYRFFAEVEGEEAVLSKEDSHHARVLRCQEGDTVEIAHDGRAWTGTIASMASPVRVTLTGEAASNEPPVSLHLIQALAKGDKLDWVIQKATELGCASVTMVSTAHADVKLQGDRAEKRRTHWQGVAEAAAKQCRRSRIPEVHGPIPLREAAENAGRPLLFCHETSETPLGTLDAQEATVCIGPEGGFSKEEVETLLALGAKPVSLGPRILRTETAAIAVLALLQHTIGDMP